MVTMLCATQGIAARVAVLDATLAGKPYGTVTYQRGIVPGTGREKVTTIEVDEEAAKYKIIERRTYRSDGAPVSAVRTYSDESRKVTMTAVFDVRSVTVETDFGSSKETQTVVLSDEKAVIVDGSQAWFYGSAPKLGVTLTYWEFSFDGFVWLSRTVKYEGVAKIKFGGKDINAHRVTVGKETTFYVDEFGMPYKTSQETPGGTIAMLRRVGS